LTTYQALETAAKTLASGGVVAHALEGVWGLACDPFDAEAVARVLRIKHRAMAKGLILIAAAAKDFEEELCDLSAVERRTVIDTWPGAVTWIVPNKRFPDWITGQHSTVAIRVPGHDQARALAARFGSPIISTSANVSGCSPATSEVLVRKYFSVTVDYVLSGKTAGAAGPSRIRSVADGTVLR